MFLLHFLGRSQWLGTVSCAATLMLLLAFRHTGIYNFTMHKIIYYHNNYYILFRFRFPSNAARQRLWVQFVETNGFAVRPTSVLCSRHFNPNDYFPGARRRLYNTAVPSIVSLLLNIILVLIV